MASQAFNRKHPADRCKRVGSHSRRTQVQNTNKDILLFPARLRCSSHGNLLGTQLMEIGAAFGGRDHSTVIHSIEKINQAIQIRTRHSKARVEKMRSVVGNHAILRRQITTICRIPAVFSIIPHVSHIRRNSGSPANGITSAIHQHLHSLYYDYCFVLHR